MEALWFTGPHSQFHFCPLTNLWSIVPYGGASRIQPGKSLPRGCPQGGAGRFARPLSVNQCPPHIIMDGSYREPSPGFQSHTGPKMLRKKGRGQVTRRLRLLDHNCRTWILTVFLQSSALPPRRMCTWWRLSRVSTTQRRASKSPKLLLRGPSAELASNGLYVSSLLAPSMLNKLQIVIWTMLERACSRNGTSLASTLSG